MPPSHAAINVIWRKRYWFFGPIDFLVVDYQSTNPRSGKLMEPEVRFPTGTNKRYPGERREATRDRVIKQETGLTCAGLTEDLNMFVKDAEHTQYGFLVAYRDCKGRLFRAKEGQDLDGDHISAPYWVSASELKTRIAPTHRRWYERACTKLGILSS